MSESTPRLAAAMSHLRWRTLVNTLAGGVAGSRFRLAMIAGCSLLFWCGLFALFLDGFRFLDQHRLIAGLLVEMLFGLFFVSLLVMLVFSTGIILHAGLFASPEAAALLARPIPADRVFLHKFQEAMFFSSWGFLLLGSPLMLAYGLTAKVGWAFYPLALGYFLAFALLPGSVGAILCLLLVNYLPRRRREALVALAGAMLVGAGWLGLSIWRQASGKTLSGAWLNNLVGQFGLSQMPFWPSHWISHGLLRATYPGGMADAVFYLLLLTANALAAYLLAAYLHARLYRRGYDRAHSHGYSRRRPRGARLAGWVNRALFFLPPEQRILVAKDVRVFTRDPLQWSQVLIFTGLLAFYFSNLGRMTYYATSPYWRNLIGFFNLAVTGLLLATFTSRFIFPLLSLEGQKFWILGLCPVSRRQVLWGKYAFAALGAGLITVPLTLLGGVMLELDPRLVALQLFTVVILCSGVSGIAVGLGARFPERKETDPSKIAAGFGGTLNLVASLVFLLVVIVTMALPCHLYSLGLSLEQGADDMAVFGRATSVLNLAQFRFWMATSVIASTFVGALATWLPMRIGARAFERMEF